MAEPAAHSDASFSFELTPPLDTLLQLAALEGLTLQDVVATALQSVIDGCLTGTQDGARGDSGNTDQVPASSHSFRAMLASVRNTRAEAAARPAGISEVQAVFMLRLRDVQAQTGFQLPATA